MNRWKTNSHILIVDLRCNQSIGKAKDTNLVREIAPRSLMARRLRCFKQRDTSNCPDGHCLKVRIQDRFEVVKTIMRIREDAPVVIELHQTPRHPVAPDAIVQDRRSKQHCVWTHVLFQVGEHGGLCLDVARQAVEQIVDSHRIVLDAVHIDWFQHIGLASFRLVASNSLCRGMETILIQIQQDDVWIRRGKITTIKKEPSPHANVQVIRRNIFVVHFKQVAAGAFPDEAIGKSKH